MTTVTSIQPYDVVATVLREAREPLTINQVVARAKLQRTVVLYSLTQLLEAERVVYNEQRRWSYRWVS